MDYIVAAILCLYISATLLFIRNIIQDREITKIREDMYYQSTLLVMLAEKYEELERKVESEKQLQENL